MAASVKRWARWEYGGLALVLALLLLVRLYGVTHSPYEAGEIWRQSDTESIAVNFLARGWTPLEPNFFYDGPFPNVVALELQVTTSLIALLYAAFGRLFFLARLVPIGFFLGSCVYLYLFGRRYLGHAGALWGTLVYGLLPVNLFVSRSVQPESAALCFTAGALYHFARFSDAGRREGLHLVLAALFLALAAMHKPQTLLAGLPLLGLAWKRFGWRFLRQPKLWAFAVAVLFLPAAYYLYSNQVAEFRFSQGIATQHILTRFYSDFLSPAARAFFLGNVDQSYTWIGLALMAGGLLWIGRNRGPLYLWALASVVNAITVVAVIRLYYYQVHLTPPLALLAGGLLANLGRRLKVLPVLLVAALAVVGFQAVEPLYAERTEIIRQAEAVRLVTGPDDLIVAGTLDPAVINAAGRPGWRYQLHYYPHIPTDPMAELQYYMDRGATYFVPIQGYIHGDDTGVIRRYLDDHFPRVEPIPGYFLYDLGGAEKLP